MKLKPRMIRQGDVLLKPVTALPETLTAKTDPARGILAWGETTGHKHQIDDLEAVDVLVASDGRIYLKAKEAGASLRHEEHSAIEILPGNYEVVIQREYSPEAIRNVAD